MTDGKYANISILYVRTYLHLLLVESTYLGIVKHRLHVWYKTIPSGRGSCVTSVAVLRSGTAVSSSSRHLSSIVKITSKKRQPEIITFKVEYYRLYSHLSHFSHLVPCPVRHEPGRRGDRVRHGQVLHPDCGQSDGHCQDADREAEGIVWYFLQNKQWYTHTIQVDCIIKGKFRVPQKNKVFNIEQKRAIKCFIIFLKAQNLFSILCKLGYCNINSAFYIKI